jgi:hypothetical protein
LLSSQLAKNDFIQDLDTGTFHEGHWRAERNLGLALVRGIASNNYNTSAEYCEISMPIISLDQDRCRGNSKL